MATLEHNAALRVVEAATGVAATAATGGAVADIGEALQVFQLLEPPLQAAIAALVHRLHHPREIPGPSTPTPAVPVASISQGKPPGATIMDLSSTSLDPDNPAAPTT